MVSRLAAVIVGIKCQLLALSAMEHPEVVEQYLTDEILAGRMIGPFSENAIPGFQISCMEVITKGHIPG